MKEKRKKRENINFTRFLSIFNLLKFFFYLVTKIFEANVLNQSLFTCYTFNAMPCHQTASVPKQMKIIIYRHNNVDSSGVNDASHNENGSHSKTNNKSFQHHFVIFFRYSIFWWAERTLAQFNFLYNERKQNWSDFNARLESSFKWNFRIWISIVFVPIILNLFQVPPSLFSLCLDRKNSISSIQ